MAPTHRHLNPGDQADLLTAAQEMTNVGLHLEPGRWDAKAPAMPRGYRDGPVGHITKETMTRCKAGTTTSIRVVLGERSALSEGGQTVIAVALELEAAAKADPIWQTNEWAAAAVAKGTRPVLDAMAARWEDKTPSGGVRWFAEVMFDSLDDYRQLKSRIAGHMKAHHEGQLYAELLLDNATVAPSIYQGGRWSRVRGGPTRMARITPDDLLALSALLDDVDDAPRNEAREHKPVSQRCRVIRQRFNAGTPDDVTADRLYEVGWKLLARSGDGEIEVVRPGASDPNVRSACVGGPDRQPGSVFMYSTGDPTFGRGWHSAFDVVSLLQFGDDDEACAEGLVAQRLVEPPPSSSMPAHRERLHLDSDTDKLVVGFLTALQSSTHPSDPNLPFAFAVISADDVHQRTVSLEADGRLHAWMPGDPALLLAVAQPVHGKKGTPAHEVPRAICSMVHQRIVAGGILPKVKLLGDGTPVLTPTGKVLAAPGWYPEHEALVAIPAAERNEWAADYQVPEHPTPSDAQAAYDHLSLELFSDFPLEDPADRAGAVAYVLTCASRSLYDIAPGVVSSGTDRGVGKGKLLDVCRLAGTGRVSYLEVSPSHRDDGETKKEIGTAAAEGTMFLHVDDLARDEKVTSRALLSIITGSAATQRLLGGNGSVATGGMIVEVCGNNAEVSGDHERRFLPIFQAWHGAGRPNERTEWRHPRITEWVRQNRPMVLGWIHTLLAYGLQHPSADTPCFGDFPAWSDAVLGALAHVREDGQSAAQVIVDNRRAWAATQDDEADEWGPFLALVHHNFTLAESKECPKWWTTATLHAWMSRLPVRPLPLPDVLAATCGRVDAPRKWVYALTRRKGTTVAYDGKTYRLKLQRESKWAAKFTVDLVEEREATITQLRVRSTNGRRVAITIPAARTPLPVGTSPGAAWRPAHRDRPISMDWSEPVRRAAELLRKVDETGRASGTRVEQPQTHEGSGRATAAPPAQQALSLDTPIEPSWLRAKGGGWAVGCRWR